MLASADYFDGKTSRRHAVSVDLSDGVLRVTGDGLALSVEADAVRARSRLGSTPLRVELPDGGLLVGSELAALGPQLPAHDRGTADRLESHLGVVLLAIGAVMAFGWFAYRAAIPWIASQMARRFPPLLEQELGREAMNVLDQRLFGSSGLEEARQTALTARFAEMRAHAALPDAVLSFREGRAVGANAFAMPGGTVVLTDELAERLTDDQITAVVAHELGHVEARHALRALFQNSAVAVVATALLGDAGAVTLLAASLPTLLAQASYSRDHEREADAFALMLLRRADRPPRLLGDALAAIERIQAGDDDGEHWAAGPLRYLSTHPVTDDRIRAAEEAAAAP